MSIKKVGLYQKIDGKTPFLEWQNKLDIKLKNKVDQKIIRLQNGNYSDCSILKDTDGVKESRIKTSSGIRIYFGEEQNEIIILLIGGDKDTQENDIKKAKIYWQEYKKRR